MLNKKSRKWYGSLEVLGFVGGQENLRAEQKQ